jgi:hypothetical protein
VRPDTARKVANLILITAGAAAVYVVVTTPPLRRLAGIGVRRWLGANLPGFLAVEAGRAWAASDRRSQS